MPWLTIIITLLSFFASKKSGNSTGQSLAIAGLAGSATYFTARETEWGRENLGQLDGVLSSATDPATFVGPPETLNLGSGYSSTTGANTSAAAGILGTVKSLGNNTADVLTGWGASGTATVVGTAGVVSALTSSPLLLAGAAVAAALIISR